MALIIPKNPIAVETNWQKELAQCFTAPEDLLRYLDFEPADFSQDIAARKLFPMRVPRPFAKKMQPGCLDDPLFRQVFPVGEEFHDTPGYSADPLSEQNNPTPGLLQKYQSRVLLMVRTGCAVNCRYCFRRHFPYQQNSVNRQGWEQTIEQIRENQQVNEVIYSGGDPLMANDDFLAWLTEQIQRIPHVKRLRIHTRLPVVIPARLNSELLNWLESTPLKVIMVLHINHAQEIDAELVARLDVLRRAGVVLLNQSVLLKGINDAADDLVNLSEALFDGGIMPYYIHLLDKVAGAAHFDVSEEQGRQLLAQMVKRLPGFLVPKLVREIGGQPGKTPIDLHLNP